MATFTKTIRKGPIKVKITTTTTVKKAVEIAGASAPRGWMHKITPIGIAVQIE